MPSPGSPSAISLLLVGTVHGDPAGYARVRRLLEYFRPQVVTVEISPFSVRYRERHGPRWQKLLEKALAHLPQGAAGHLAIRRLMTQAAMPFEWKAAASWGRQYDVKVHAVDSSAPARQHLPRYSREVLVPENLRALLALPEGSLSDFVGREFARARLVSLKPPAIPSGAALKESARRERHAARRLKVLAATGHRLLHLGGWEHLVPRVGGPNLFDLLADFSPLRILLDEADRLPEAAGYPGAQDPARPQG